MHSSPCCRYVHWEIDPEDEAKATMTMRSGAGAQAASNVPKWVPLGREG